MDHRLCRAPSKCRRGKSTLAEGHEEYSLNPPSRGHRFGRHQLAFSFDKVFHFTGGSAGVVQEFGQGSPMGHRRSTTRTLFESRRRLE